MLERLGMRALITRRAVLESARSIEQLAALEPEAARQRARALLRYIDEHSNALIEFTPAGGPPTRSAKSAVSKLFSKLAPSAVEPSRDVADGDFCSELASRAWLPLLRERPEPYLPWPDEARRLPTAASASVRPREDAWLVSASFGLLDGEARSESLRRLLGWIAPPSLPTLATQLSALACQPAPGELPHQQAMAIAVPALYRALERSLVAAGAAGGGCAAVDALAGGGGASATAEEVLVALQPQQCVWVGAGSSRLLTAPSPRRLRSTPSSTSSPPTFSASTRCSSASACAAASRRRSWWGSSPGWPAATTR